METSAAPIQDPEFGMFEDVKEQEKETLASEGHKYDEGKTRYELLPTLGLEGAAQVLTYGNDKYALDHRVSENNWMKGIRWSRMFGATMRHLWAWMRGEDLDPESGLHHLDHATANVLILRGLTAIDPENDDRPTHDYNGQLGNL